MGTVWVTIKQPDRRFWSLVPFGRAPFWVHHFDPQPSMLRMRLLSVLKTSIPPRLAFAVNTHRDQQAPANLASSTDVQLTLVCITRCHWGALTSKQSLAQQLGLEQRQAGPQPCHCRAEPSSLAACCGSDLAKESAKFPRNACRFVLAKSHRSFKQ